MGFDTKKPVPTEVLDSPGGGGGVPGGGSVGAGGSVGGTVGLRSLKQFTIVRIAAADLPRFQLSLVERYWLVLVLRMLNKISP